MAPSSISRVCGCSALSSERGCRASLPEGYFPARQPTRSRWVRTWPSGWADRRRARLTGGGKSLLGVPHLPVERASRSSACWVPRSAIFPPPAQRSRKARGCAINHDQAQCGSASLQPRPAARRPGRRRRGCCGRSGCWGGSRPEPARSRRGCARTAGWPRPAARRPGRRRRGCCGRSGFWGGSRPGPARGRRGCARAAGWLHAAARRPGRRRRGCCSSPGCPGGSRPEPAQSRRGCARTAGWPRPAARRPGRRERGCCGKLRVLGWISPRTCSRSARVRSYSEMASSSRPAAR